MPLLLLTFLWINGCRSAGPLASDYVGDVGSLATACESGQGAACALIGRPAPPRQSLPILQGLTSRSSARITVVLPKSDHPSYVVREGSKNQWISPRRVEKRGVDTVVDQLEITNLRPGVDFELLVFDPRSGVLWDKRIFRALDDTKTHARIALLSAMDETLKTEAKRIWPTVVDQEPDLIVLVGNAVYVDHGADGQSFIAPEPTTIWRRYAEARHALPLYFTPRLIPTLATWDDHDFGYANADQTYPHRGASLETFLTFYDQASPSREFTRGPGIAAWWSGFGIELGLTDNRSFRTVDRAAGDQSHFGRAQEDWIVERLGAATRPVFLVAGDQFFGGYHGFASFEGSHPRSFGRELARWREALRSPLVLISANRRVSAIASVPSDTLGFDTFEITTGGLHTKVNEDSFILAPNPRVIAGQLGTSNFTVLEVMRAEPGLLRLGVQSFGPNARLIYQRTVAVKR